MMKSLVLMSAFVFSQVAYAAGGGVPSTGASSLQLGAETETPGGVLKSGGYTIRIADHLADRVVIEVRNAQGDVDEKFLGVPARDIPASSPAGPVLAAGENGASALRGFSFARGNVIEFVYPKNDAVGLAKASGSTVLAIDPASEGMPAVGGLDAADMKIVTLWMLTPKPVGPDSATVDISAARYKGKTTGSKEVAEARPPVVSRLPKTGSDLPWLVLLACGWFGLALMLRVRRMVARGL